MKIILTPVLQDLRNIYDAKGVMPRFEAYRSLMLTQRGETLPLGVFSPMGKKQPDYLDRLMAMDAESIARDTIEKVLNKLSGFDSTYRIVLVVVDEKYNGWTERHVTDAEWRFQNKYDTVPKQDPSFDRWVTVQLWTDTEPTSTYIQQETLSAIYRALHQQVFGLPKTLLEMIEQEGRAHVFAGRNSSLSQKEVQQGLEDVSGYLESSNYAMCFTVLYGDMAGEKNGYSSLGFPTAYGFSLAVGKASYEEAPLLFISELLKPCNKSKK